MSALVPELQKRIHELEATVKQLTKDRDELYNDLERSLVRKDSSFWQSSNIHEERLNQSKAENQQLQEQLKRVTAQRDSFLDDNVQIQRVKHDADLISKEQIDANSALERELEFFKRQCAQALEERNAFASELEELKKTHLELERDSVHLKERLQTERRRREKVEDQNDEVVTRVKQLQDRLVDYAKTPQLEGQFQTLQTEFKRLKFQLEHAQQTAHDETDATGGSDLRTGVKSISIDSKDQIQDNNLVVDQEVAVDCHSSQEVESLNKALDLVTELVPRFKSVHEMLKAQSLVDASVGDSLAALDQIQQAMNDLWNELETQKNEEGSSNRNSVHVLIGKEAIALALSCISILKESLHSGV